MKAKSSLIYLLSFLLLILLPAVTIYAGEVSRFFKEYTREKGQPVTITDTFYSAHEGPGTLKVTTNALETGGKITFNGQVLLMQGDFKEQITYYKKEVTLHNGNNTIEVYDESKPGAWMQIEITHQDSAATSEYIGSSGGTLTEPGGASISIPAGALTEERLISIITHHSAASLPAPAPLVGGVRMGPDGLVFQLPVTITVPLNTDFTPGAELPIFLYDSQKNGWAYTGIFAYVNSDGLSASFNVTHFTDWIIMGVGPDDSAKYFGAFEAKFFDICNHTPTVDLYHELQDLWTTAYFPIGHKSIWDTFPNRDYACYEVAGIRFLLTTSRAVPGEKKGKWVSIEDGLYDNTIGDEGPIALVFLHDENRQIQDSACGEQQLAYSWDVYVYLKCASPDIHLGARQNNIHPEDQTVVTACLFCGDEPMVNQEIDFTLDGPGHFDAAKDQYTSAMGCADISLSADDAGTLNVYGEYESCPGQEPPWNPSVYDMSPINVEYRTASVELVPDSKTINVGQKFTLEANVYDENGEKIPEGCPSDNFTWTIPDGGIIGFNPDTHEVTGVSEGTATITYTCEGQSDDATITVEPGTATYRLTWHFGTHMLVNSDWSQHYTGAIDVVLHHVMPGDYWVIFNKSDILNASINEYYAPDDVYPCSGSWGIEWMWQSGYRAAISKNPEGGWYFWFDFGSMLDPIECCYGSCTEEQPFNQCDPEPVSQPYLVPCDDIRKITSDDINDFVIHKEASSSAFEQSSSWDIEFKRLP